MYGSSEQMNCGKVTLEPLQEPCEPVQILSLNVFARTLNTFVEIFTKAFLKVMIQSDHMSGDTHMFFLEQARSTGETLLDATQTVIRTVTRDDSETVTKATYYETLFTIQETLLPAVKAVEALLGEHMQVEGHLYSQAIVEFLAIA
jgi:hypothetical protein